MSAEWIKIDSLPHSSLAETYVFGVIQTSLEITLTVTFDPELDFLKQNCVMYAEWSTLDSHAPFLFCTEICVGLIQTTLQLTVTVTFIQELEFLNRTGLCLQSGVHVTYFVPSSLA
jgi:hypothetical protein